MRRASDPPGSKVAGALLLELFPLRLNRFFYKSNRVGDGIGEHACLAVFKRFFPQAITLLRRLELLQIALYVLELTLQLRHAFGQRFTQIRQVADKQRLPIGSRRIGDIQF